MSGSPGRQYVGEVVTFRVGSGLNGERKGFKTSLTRLFLSQRHGAGRLLPSARRGPAITCQRLLKTISHSFSDAFAGAGLSTTKARDPARGRGRFSANFGRLISETEEEKGLKNHRKISLPSASPFPASGRLREGRQAAGKASSRPGRRCPGTGGGRRAVATGVGGRLAGPMATGRPSPERPRGGGAGGGEHTHTHPPPQPSGRVSRTKPPRVGSGLPVPVKRARGVPRPEPWRSPLRERVPLPVPAVEAAVDTSAPTASTGSSSWHKRRRQIRK